MRSFEAGVWSRDVWGQVRRAQSNSCQRAHMGCPSCARSAQGEWGWCACREVILICKTMCDCVSTSLSYHTHVLFGGGGALYVRAIPAQFSGLF